MNGEQALSLAELLSSHEPTAVMTLFKLGISACASGAVYHTRHVSRAQSLLLSHPLLDRALLLCNCSRSLSCAERCRHRLSAAEAAGDSTSTLIVLMRGTFLVVDRRHGRISRSPTICGTQAPPSTPAGKAVGIFGSPPSPRTQARAPGSSGSVRSTGGVAAGVGRLARASGRTPGGHR